MMTNMLRGRVSSEAVDENRFSIYSPEWYFTRYTDLMVSDLNAEIPIKHGLTLADALAFVDKKYGWNGILSDLKFDMALSAHRTKYWAFSQIGRIYLFSPVSVDMLMLFQKEFGDEEVGDLIEKKVRQLNYLRGQKTIEGELAEVIEATVRALSATHASVLFHNLIYSAIIDRSVELQASSRFLGQLITSKNGSDAVVRNYAIG